MIFSLLIIHNHDRMSSITCDLHTTTWVYFTEHLADRFIRSPKEVKEEIMCKEDNALRIISTCLVARLATGMDRAV